MIVFWNRAYHRARCRFGVMSEHVLVHFGHAAVFFACFPMWLDLVYRGVGVIAPVPRWHYNAPTVDSILEYPRRSECIMYSFFWLFAYLKMNSHVERWATGKKPDKYSPEKPRREYIGAEEAARLWEAGPLKALKKLFVEVRACEERKTRVGARIERREER